MKLIYKIARAELRNLFYSPIAWVLIIAFLVLSGMDMFSPLKHLARQQDVFIANSPSWPGFTGSLTSVLFKGFSTDLLNYLYLFLPLITMGVINREVNNGTIHLLYSSPVKTSDIVFGKYLALLVFNAILLLLLALLFLTGYLSVKNAEFPLLLSMMLGFFLITSVYSAVGIYISSLTNYQVLAGAATFIVFLILKQVGGLWQQVDFVRELTWFLSIDGRVENMMVGLITTRDIFYFLLIMVLFLGLTLIRLRSKQQSAKSWILLAKNTGLLVAVLLLGYFSSRPGYIGYLDTTRNKINTIDTATQTVLKELDGSPVTVTLYVNLLGQNLLKGVPAARNNYVWTFWDKYVRFYPNIHFKYEYYYSIDRHDSTILTYFPGKTIHQIARQLAKVHRLKLSLFQKPEELFTKVDLSEEPLNMLMELEYKGRKSFLRTYPHREWPVEENVSGSFKAIARGEVPLVAFTSGHYERSPWRKGEREYSAHTSDKLVHTSLVNEGVKVDTISLQEDPIPANTSVLVVADPKKELDSAEQNKIVDFLKNGGNALFYAEPGKQQLLNPIVNQLGIHIDDGVIVSPRKHEEAMDFTAKMTKQGNYMARETAMQAYQIYHSFGAEADLSGVAALSVGDQSGFTIEPIITIPPDKNLWIENGLFVKDSAAPEFADHEGDIRKQEYIAAVKLSRIIHGKEQRIVVTGDADFMSRKHRSGKGIGNGIYSWLLYNEYPVYTSIKVTSDRFLSIDKSTSVILYNVFVYVLPAILLVLGTTLLIRRKRK